MVIYNAGNSLLDGAIFGYYVDPTATTIKGRTKYLPMTDISRDLKSLYSDGVGGYTISNADFIIIAERIAKSRAQSYAEFATKGVYTASINCDGDFYSVGKKYSVFAPRNGFAGVNMRLTRAVHTFDKNGWNVLLDLEEDPQELNNL